MVTLAIVCSSAYMFASELIVKGKIDAPFSVYVNGEKYYSYKNKVDVGYIPSGCYNLEIYTEGAYSELLYDYKINIPRRSTVYATFTGDNRMYISTEKDAPATIIVDLTPYPRRVHAPVPVYHSKPAHHAPAPKPAPHKAAPAPKPAPHKAAPAPKPAPKHDAPSAPRTNHKAATPTAHSTAKAAPAKNEAKPAVKPSSPAPKNDTKSNTTVRTSSSSSNSKATSSTRTSSTRSTVNTRK